MCGKVLRGQCQGQRKNARGSSNEARGRRDGRYVRDVMRLAYAFSANGYQCHTWPTSKVSALGLEGQYLEKAERGVNKQPITAQWRLQYWCTKRRPLSSGIAKPEETAQRGPPRTSLLIFIHKLANASFDTANGPSKLCHSVFNLFHS